MTTEAWGLMTKSQDDPEKIEEAVARLIAAHNADSSAHTGAGEALAVHREYGVVDHPAGSVLADKRTMSEITIQSDFASLAGWSTTGNVSNDNYPTAALYVEHGAVERSDMSTTPELPGGWLDYRYDALFQIAAGFVMSNTHYNAWLGMGLADEDATDGFGFVIRDGRLMMLVQANGEGSAEWLDGVDMTKMHCYRAQLAAQEGVVRFFVDGTQTGQFSLPQNNPLSDAGPAFGVRLSQENDGHMYVADLAFSRGLIQQAD